MRASTRSRARTRLPRGPHREQRPARLPCKSTPPFSLGLCASPRSCPPQAGKISAEVSDSQERYRSSSASSSHRSAGCAQTHEARERGTQVPNAGLTPDSVKSSSASKGSSPWASRVFSQRPSLEREKRFGPLCVRGQCKGEEHVHIRREPRKLRCKEDVPQWRGPPYLPVRHLTVDDVSALHPKRDRKNALLGMSRRQRQR